MPYRIHKPCAHPGCPNVTSHRYCEKHEHQARRAKEECRSHQGRRLYNDRRWRRARAAYLHEHPLCESCRANGYMTPATEIHHHIPHNGDYELFWDQDNWVGLCHPCHSTITSTEGGAFGNPTPPKISGTSPL